jgi:O-6-methylguanine DNA methyltransferase
MSCGFHLFETAIGTCAIAWGDKGIVGLQLPEATEKAARTRLRARFPSLAEAAPTRDVRYAARRIRNLLEGEPEDLSDLVLDMEAVPPFHRLVYEEARKLPPGRTCSYGEIAFAAGSPKSARAVGQAMRRNPFPIVVPCHRVLAAGGRVGGFTAEGGIVTKQRMLEIEGAALPRANAARQDAVPRRNFSPQTLSTAVRSLRAADPTLAGLIDGVGACRLSTDATQSVFGALAEAIVYQQLTGKAAATIHGRVCALFPRAKNGFTPKQLLTASGDELRGCGLSRAKTAALLDLAAKTIDGTVPTLDEADRMSDDEIVERLTSVRGIGRWTVEMLLIFRLGRPDVLPVDDYGVRKGYAAAFRKRDLPSRKQLERAGERWKPFRSIASWYLWRAADTAVRRSKAAKKKKRPSKKTSAKTSATKNVGAARKPARRKAGSKRTATR